MQNKIFILAALLLYINLSKGRIGHFPSSDELPDEATPFRHLLSNADLTPELMLEWESDTDPDAVFHHSTRRRGNRTDRSGTVTRATARVCNGQEAQEGMFPFAAYLDCDGYYCSGSVIAPKVILSAAHCVRDSTGWERKEDIKIWVGAADYNNAVGRDVAVR